MCQRTFTAPEYRILNAMATGIIGGTRPLKLPETAFAPVPLPAEASSAAFRWVKHLVAAGQNALLAQTDRQPRTVLMEGWIRRI